MEILNLIALLLIALSNVFIGLKIRNQKTVNNVVLPPVQITNEMSNPTPMVTVLAEPSDVSIDYDKLSTAIKRALMESQVATYNALGPPVVLPKEVQYTVPAPINVSELVTNVEVDGVPTKQFPRNA